MDKNTEDLFNEIANIYHVQLTEVGRIIEFVDRYSRLGFSQKDEKSWSLLFKVSYLPSLLLNGMGSVEFPIGFFDDFFNALFNLGYETAQNKRERERKTKKKTLALSSGYRDNVRSTLRGASHAD